MQQKIPSFVASWTNFENSVHLFGDGGAVVVVEGQVHVCPVIALMRGAVGVGGDSGIPPMLSVNLARAVATALVCGWAWHVVSHVECRKVWDCANCRLMRKGSPLLQIELQDWAHGWGAGCDCVCGDDGRGRAGEAGGQELLECGGHSNSSCPLRHHYQLRSSRIPSPRHYCSSLDVAAFCCHSMLINSGSVVRIRGGPSLLLLPLPLLLLPLH